ncbi:MAG: hypothetical protein A2583_02045 [Bdellovibrionales bacterium RIFOXYD1_FULL_53_11]|nr:MAG: hypothetical protein A2583_02045 [Bdellovibrionales bacterium RIFOXYD1_FULL_53_11]
MNVKRLPPSVKISLALILLAIPIAGLQVYISSAAPWWRPNYRAMATAALSSAAIFLPLTIMIARGKLWAVPATGLAGMIWCILTAWMGLRNKNPSIGLFFLLLSIYWFAAWIWLRHETGRSFFNPDQKWFEGSPRPIPGLSCLLGQQSVPARVCRIDTGGAFVFNNSPEGRTFFSALRPSGRVGISFVFRDSTVACLGLPVTILDGGAGAGFTFAGMDPDSKKMLGDFIETLRGEGHE